MTFYRAADPDYFDAITPEFLRYTQRAARGAGLDLGSIVMGPDGDLDAPMVSVLQLPPNGVLPRHAHNCYRVEVVLRGSIDTGEGEPLGPGDTMVSPPGEYYGPHIAGPEGATTVEIFSMANNTTEFAPVDDPAMAAVIANAQREFSQGQGRS